MDEKNDASIDKDQRKSLYQPLDSVYESLGSQMDIKVRVDGQTEVSATHTPNNLKSSMNNNTTALRSNFASTERILEEAKLKEDIAC